jgi:hypothetical protein
VLIAGDLVGDLVGVFAGEQRSGVRHIDGLALQAGNV